MSFVRHDNKRKREEEPEMPDLPDEEHGGIFDGSDDQTHEAWNPDECPYIAVEKERLPPVTPYHAAFVEAQD